MTGPKRGPAPKADPDRLTPVETKDAATHPHKYIGTVSTLNTTSVLESAASAEQGIEAERRMSIREGLQLYPKAIGWSAVLSLAIIMEGYDVVLLASFYATPAFKRKYGVPLNDGSGMYHITPAWEAGLSNGANIGEILGLFATGIAADRYGFRKTMIGALVLVCAFVFIQFFAPNQQVLLMAEVLLGIPWGVFQTLATTYAAEVLPTQLRAYMCTYSNLCWVIGQIIGTGVVRVMLSRFRDDPYNEWAYRIPFAMQWIWPVPIIIGCLLAPESPWWLIRKERLEEAKASLARLTSTKAEQRFSLDDTLANMVATNDHEKSMQSGVRYSDCFKGVDLRRTEIVCVTWAVQQLCGSILIPFSAYFLQRLGMSDDNAFNMTIAQYGIGIFGVLTSWFAMTRYGRRDLYFWGLVAMMPVLLVIGVLGLVEPGKHADTWPWICACMLLLFTFVYDCTVGPVAYSLVTELSSTRLRQKTVVLARNLYNLFGILNNTWTPYMLNPMAWNWGGKTGFFWVGFCLLCILWVYFRLPEPKGRSYGELDLLFENKISARKFNETDVSTLNGSIERAQGKGAERSSFREIFFRRPIR